MKLMTSALALAALTLAAPASAAIFTNGGFESGDLTGWTIGGGYRGNDLNPLTLQNFLPGGSEYNASIASSHSEVISNGYVDPILGAPVGDTTYGGTGHALRLEDTFTGGYASVVSQTVTGYSDPSIFFSWKAVLQNGGHSDDESAIFQLVLEDLTTSTVLISRSYNAGVGGGGVDNRFVQSGNYFYTPDWQIEQLDVSASLGHDFRLTVLAADCNPTGHRGYAYLDGFGGQVGGSSTSSGGDVPEPATLSLLGLGIAGLGFARRRKA